MSSVQYPSSPTYHTSVEQKLLSRNAARNYKLGSPKLQDLLRQRCRVRVREARQASFDSARNSAKAGENSLVSKILRQELADLQSDLNLQEQIFQELIDEINLWYAEQLEEEEQYLIEVGDTNFVFCPVCQKAALEQCGQQITCKCGVSFDFRGQLDTFQSAIEDVITQHGLECNNLLGFFVEQDSSKDLKTLNAMCESCDYFISVT